MKKNMWFYLSLCTLAIVLLLSGCGGSDDENGANGDPGKALVKALNESPLGFTITIDPANISAKPEGNQFLVTLTNPSIQFNLSSLNDLMKSGVTFKNEKLTFQMNEWVFRYDPQKKFLAMVSCKGFTCETDFLKLLNIPPDEVGENIKVFKFKASVDHLVYQKELDISAILDPEKKIPDILHFLLQNNKNMNAHIEKFKLLLDMEKNDDTMTFNLEIGSLDAIQYIDKLYFPQLSDKENNVDEFQALLQSGKPLLDSHGQGHDVKISITKKNNLTADFNIASLESYYALKPDPSKSFFQCVLGFNVNTMSVSSPQLPALSAICNLNQFKLDFSLEPISANVMSGYLRLSQDQHSLNNAASDEERTKALTKIMTMAQEFFSAKPTVSLSINPLNHSFGEITASGKFTISLETPPCGNAEMTIKKFDDFFSKLKTAGLIPPEQIDTVFAFLKGYLIIDENGDAKASLESRQDDTHHVLINGKPLPL